MRIFCVAALKNQSRGVMADQTSARLKAAMVVIDAFRRCIHHLCGLIGAETSDLYVKS